MCGYSSYTSSVDLCLLTSFSIRLSIQFSVRPKSSACLGYLAWSKSKERFISAVYLIDWPSRSQAAARGLQTGHKTKSIASIQGLSPPVLQQLQSLALFSPTARWRVPPGQERVGSATHAYRSKQRCHRLHFITLCLYQSSLKCTNRRHLYLEVKKLLFTDYFL